MEQKRLFLAIAISLAIVLGFQMVYERFLPHPPPKTTTITETTRHGTTETKAVPARPPQPSQTIGVAPSDGGVAPVGPTKPSPRLEIAAPQVKGSVDLLGARLDDLVLRDYRETIQPTSPLVRLLEPRTDPEPYYVQFGWTQGPNTHVKVPGADTLWSASAPTLTPTAPVTLAWNNGQGLTFEIVLSVDDHYMFTVQQRVKNATAAPVALYAWSRIRRDYTPKTAGYYILHEGLIGVVKDRLQEMTYSSARSDAKKHDGLAFHEADNGGWAGITDKYWLTALIPNQAKPVTASFRALNEGAGHAYQVDFIPQDPQQIAPGTTAGQTTRLFAGAKVVTLLDRYQSEYNIPHFDKAVDFGWFYFLTKPIFLCLDWLYHLLGNFGVAIMVFTVFVKALFFPLANKSYKSMSKMRLLGPKLQAMRERLKDDPGKMQQEMMAIYKAEGVNPASGCLPMLIQVPVFFSLYKVIFVTIEMRHAPFFGWISGSLGARSDQRVQPVRAAAVPPRRDFAVPAPGRLAARHGVHDVAAAAAEPAAAGPHAGETVPVHAGDLHLHAGALPGRAGDLLDVEQFAVGRPAMADHAQHAAGAEADENGPHHHLSEPADDAAAIEAGRLLFAAECRFVHAAQRLDQLLPPDLPELAFAGRSNVGKSSLLNALTGRRTLARASNQPGRTRQLNFFELGGRLMLVDMPGYGYAQAPKDVKADWQGLMFDYLRGRPNLARVLLLLDARIEAKPADLAVMDLLDRAAVSYQLVLTKADGVKPAPLARKETEARALARRHTAAHPDVITTSSETGAGLETLRAAIASLGERSTAPRV